MTTQLRHRRSAGRAFKAVGLALGATNTVRHRLVGYTRPRPFDPSDVDPNIRHAEEVVAAWEQRGKLDLVGQRVLELGPGSDLTTGALLLHRGATRYLAADAFDNRSRANRDHYAELGRRLGHEVPLADLGFVQTSFPDLPAIDERFDLICSNATLEHIERLPALFVRLHELASPGCRMVHHIDRQTHMRGLREQDPLNILRYSDKVYRRLLAFPGAPNRLGARDYLNAAASAGWKRAEVIPVARAAAPYLNSIVHDVDERFRDRDDLALLTFTLVCAA